MRIGFKDSWKVHWIRAREWSWLSEGPVDLWHHSLIHTAETNDRSKHIRWILGFERNVHPTFGTFHCVLITGNMLKFPDLFCLWLLSHSFVSGHSYTLRVAPLLWCITVTTNIYYCCSFDTGSVFNQFLWRGQPGQTTTLSYNQYNSWRILWYSYIWTLRIKTEGMRRTAN